MRAGKFTSTLCLALVLPMSPASGEELDLTVELKKILFSEHDKILLRHPDLANGSCRADGSIDGGIPMLSYLIRCGFKFTNVRAVAIDVKYSDPIAGAIPTTIIRDVWQYQNCNDTPLPINDSINLATQEGSSVTTSTQITAGSNSQTTEGVTIPIYAVSFNYSTNVTYSFQKNEQEQQASSLTETRSTNQIIEITVPPKSVYSVTLQKEVSNAYIDFDGTVILDADAFMYPLRGPSATKDPQGPDVPLGKVSEVASEASRTVHLRGQIWNAKGHDVTRKDDIKQIPSDSDICSQSKNPIVVPQIIQRDEGGSNLLAENFNTKEIYQLFAGGVQTTQPLTSGMTITTSDSVANVEIRAKSLGPGFCAVGISSPYGQANFLSPPLSWSPWTNLFAHVGAITATLNTSVGCDTGALFEVRYFK